MELVLLMYNVHPYFSLKNFGKNSVHNIQQNICECSPPYICASLNTHTHGLSGAF